MWQGTRGGVCKDLLCQKTRVGEEGKLERMLYDVTGTSSMVWSCCEKVFEKKNFTKDAKILQLSRKYSKTNLAKL